MAKTWLVATCAIALSTLWASVADATGPSTRGIPKVRTARVRATVGTTTTTVAPTTTTVAPTTTTTTAAPTTMTTVRPPPPSAAAADPAMQPGWGCAAALAYLATYAAPGFTSICPGPDNGHQGSTVAYYHNGAVTGVISIVDPCPASYKNEAHNSWVLRSKYLGTPIPDGLGPVIDPFGYCT